MKIIEFLPNYFNQSQSSPLFNRKMPKNKKGIKRETQHISSFCFLIYFFLSSCQHWENDQKLMKKKANMQFTNPMYYILCLLIAHYLTVIFPNKYFKVKSHTKILSLSQYQRKHLKLCINILEKLRLLSCSIYPFQQMRKNDKGRNVQNAGL